MSQARQAVILGAAAVVVILTNAGSPATAKWKQADPPGAYPSSPSGINRGGTMAGYYWATNNQNDAHGFIRSPNGSFTTFDAGTGHTIPTAINGKGDVVGWYGPLLGGRSCAGPMAL